MLLRAAVAVFFMAHASVRVIHGTIPGFAAFLESRGWPYGVALVWAITLLELVCGTLLICNRYVRWAAAGLFFVAFMGIVIIHAPLGWFVGEHGSGGMEYSLSLMFSLLVVAAFDAEKVVLAKALR
jgi:putative oxidoreductase